jgi:hypothetical protein
VEDDDDERIDEVDEAEEEEEGCWIAWAAAAAVLGDTVTMAWLGRCMLLLLFGGEYVEEGATVAAEATAASAVAVVDVDGVNWFIRLGLLMMNERSSIFI